MTQRSGLRLLIFVTGPPPCHLKPVAAVGNPPCGEKDRDGGGARPPERKQEVGHQPEQDEDHPEYLFLHGDDCSSEATFALNPPFRGLSAMAIYR